MSISAQLPPIALAQASASLQTLALAAGGTVDAKVLGQQPNGTTQVQIGGQVLNLQLPSPPSLGTTLHLAVQQAEGQLQLTLISTTPAASATGSAASATASVVSPANVPATEVQISAAGLSSVARPAQVADAVVPQASAQQTTSRSPLNSGTLPPQTAAPVQAGGTAVVTPQQVAVAPAATPAPVGATPNASSQQANPSAGSAPAPQQSSAAPIAAPGVQISAAPPRAVPYAVAALVVASTLPAAARQASAPVVDAPVGRALASASIGLHMPPPETPQGRTGGVSSAPQPSTTQAALSQLVQRSLPGQDSVVGLTAALGKVVGRVALPEPVVKAALAVLSNRMTIDGAKLDGAMMQRAVASSGLFQEALLAAGQPKAAGADLKTALLGLQRSIGAWLGDQAPVEKVSGLPPPLRGMVPRARADQMPLSDMPDDPIEAGKVLLERTEAALSRLRLHQHASLPEPGQRQEAQWSLDLPVTIAGQQNVLQMQIHRDQDSEQSAPEERGWQVRFAINLGETGEVGAQISSRGRSTGVLVWADNADTAAMLEQGLGELRQELESVGLHVGSVLIRSGAPLAHAAPATHFLDETR